MTGRRGRTRPRRDHHNVLMVLELVHLEVTQMREEQVEAAGFIASRGMFCTMILAAARDDEFLVEQDHREAAAPMHRPLWNRDHHGLRQAVA